MDIDTDNQLHTLMAGELARVSETTEIQRCMVRVRNEPRRLNVLRVRCVVAFMLAGRSHFQRDCCGQADHITTQYCC